MIKRKEGYIDVPGGKVWYEIVGENKSIPLIVLHGGPGYPHDYLQPLEDLSDTKDVIFYDQLGCGNSDRPTEKSLWTVERFVIELEEIIRQLNLEKYHILGHSWGSALAVSLALKKPRGLVSLILSDPYLSTPIWEKDANRLLQELPEDMQKALKGGIARSKEYKEASNEFYDRYVKRLRPLPEVFTLSKKKKNNDLYTFMWGPEEFCATGTLKDFDPTKRLSEIKIPVLLLCGRYDEATPESTQYFQSLFPNAQHKVFEESAHYPFWNKRKEYIRTVKEFLQNLE